jgi:hypothetical protein
MAEWYDANMNANENVNANMNMNVNINALPNQYRCHCGCNLEFIDDEPGFDIYIGNNWLITANALVDYSWSDYMWMHEFKEWRELREDIILNYNHALNNDPMQAADAPWVHLHNVHVVGMDNIPLNEKLYYE